MIPRISFVVLLLFAAIPEPRAHGQQLSVLDRSLKDVVAWAREDTNDAERQYYLALRHWKERHWRETDSLLRLTVRLEPRHANAYYALYFLPHVRRTQLVQEERGDRVPEDWKPIVAEAHGFLKRALRTDPLLNFNVMGVAYDVEEPRVRDFTHPVYRWWIRNWAWALDLSLGRYRSAHERLTSLAQREWDEARHPERVPDAILMYRGLAAAHTLQYDKAIADFRSLLRRAERVQEEELVHMPLEDNDYRFILASLHHLAGNQDSAVALYQQALERDLGLVMAHTYLASIHEGAGRPAEAMIERRRAADISSDDPTALFDLAASLFNAGQLIEADEPLRKAITLNPRYAPPHYLLGRVTEELGLPDEARDHYQKFLALSPLRSAELRADAQQRVAKLQE